MKNNLFEELNNLITEQRNTKTLDIDTKSVIEILELINHEDQNVPFVVKSEISYIAQAVEIIVSAFNSGGRLFYIGAGSSGRLGILDASECTPTFGISPEMVQGIIAGGIPAIFNAQEGIEDNEEEGVRDLKNKSFGNRDVAFGITASRRTPYVVGAIEYARKIGAKTIYLTCTPRNELKIKVDVTICPVVGPEVIMGSTRMKSGTAQKLILNMITTTAMIRLGKIFGNMMIDLQAKNSKLTERSKRTIMIVTGVNYSTAEKVLHEADGHVKTAIVMIKGKYSRAEAESRLSKSHGFVRDALSI